MRPVSELPKTAFKVIFTDIDDTLTDHGKLGPEAYSALWELQRAGVHVVPVTGRPAGWCELIARLWPVHGVIGENGGLYFRLKGREMLRSYVASPQERKKNRTKLDQIAGKVLTEVPGCAIASDQFCRELDLAVDFAEDVGPLSKEAIHKIKDIFESQGAVAKISSIHVNGWFGDYDKLSMCKHYSKAELSTDLDQDQSGSLFAGDSPNDEPMFGFFQNSVAVANITEFIDELSEKPKFITKSPGGRGFVELAKMILSN